MKKIRRRTLRAAVLNELPPGPESAIGSLAAPRDEDGPSARAVAPIGSRSPRGRVAGEAPGVPLDAAIEAALAAPGVDALTRVHLAEARGQLAARRQDGRDGLHEPSLAQAMFTFVMPRLEHPEVLGMERQRAILEQLADELGAGHGDTVLREGALAVYRELRRIALLRQRCSSLVEG